MRVSVAAGIAVGAAALALATSSPAEEQARGGGVALRTVGTFDSPIYAHGPKGARGILFVVERDGEIKVLKKGRRRGTFLDIKNLVSCCESERGLFSVAFAPWRQSRRFYVYFTDNQGDLRISEFKRRKNRPLRARKSSRRDLLDIPHREHANHNGGQLQWGPDGRLYIATGDGGGGGTPAQDRNSLLGKILRINPLRGRPYSTPSSNPYDGGPGRDEIFSRGLRNPWRFSFAGRKIAIGDVGQDEFEEIDYERLGSARGANFGWPNYEGNSLYAGPALSNHDRPIHVYSHDAGRCSITGGYVVRKRSLGGLFGRYLYGDLCTGEVRSLKARTSGARRDRPLLTAPGSLISFGTDARRNIYVVTGDSVFKLAR